jgi:F0F1-type ATP synthase membrane subunit a
MAFLKPMCYRRNIIRTNGRIGEITAKKWGPIRFLFFWLLVFNLIGLKPAEALTSSPEKIV